MKGKWIGFVTVVCVSLLSSASAEDVYFPDANLEAVVRDALGIPAPTPITDTDMASLGSLTTGASSISNIQGLEYGINLTYLNLWWNNISDISPLAGLTNLTELELDHNQISDISPVAGLTNLSYLNLGENQISDISPVAGLTTLAELNLDINQISDISAVAGLTNLSDLRLNSNQISDISAVAGLTDLSDLRLNSNQISDISPVAGMTNLTWLGLKSNQISDISAVAGLTTNLTYLELGPNQISDISPVAGLTNLTYLVLWGNQISDLSPVAGMTNLTTLFLARNQISDTSPLAGLTNLRGLQLERNQIAILDLSSADLSSLEYFTIGYDWGSIPDNPLTTVLLVDATLSQGSFDLLMQGGREWDRDRSLELGIAEMPGVLILDMSGVDFTEIPDVSKMYDVDYYDGMDDLEKLLLAGATNLDGGQVVSLTGELASLNWLDVTGLWESFDLGAQSSLDAWDAVPGNTLIVPEPVSAVLLVLGALAIRRRRRSA